MPKIRNTMRRASAAMLVLAATGIAAAQQGNLVRNPDFSEPGSGAWEFRRFEPTYDSSWNGPTVPANVRDEAYRRAAWIGPWNGRHSVMRLVPSYLMIAQDCFGEPTNWFNSLAMDVAGPRDEFASRIAGCQDCGEYGPVDIVHTFQRAYPNAYQRGMELSEPRDERYLTLSFDVRADLRAPVFRGCGQVEIPGYNDGGSMSGSASQMQPATQVLTVQVIEHASGSDGLPTQREHEFGVLGGVVAQDWRRVTFNVPRSDDARSGASSYELRFWLTIHEPAPFTGTVPPQRMVAEVGIDRVDLRLACHPVDATSQNPDTGCIGKHLLLAPCEGVTPNPFNCVIPELPSQVVAPRLATADANAQQLDCLEPTSACLGDIDGDGAVTGSDLGILLGDWGMQSGCSDLDGDGMVSGGDIGLLLGSWGPC